MTKRINVASLAAALCVLCVSPLLAGQTVGAPAIRSKPGATPPPPPVPPATVSRSVEGGVTVRAVRISEPLKLDGRLDEGVYATVPAIGDFVQQEPRAGEPATEKTGV